MVVQHFRAFMDYNAELLEYVVMADIKCLGDMLKLMTKRGIEAAIPVLAKAKKSYSPPTSPS